MKKRFLSILVLLAAVATGAWAQWTGGTHTATANENLNAINVSDDATLTINQGVTVTVSGGITVANGKTLTVTGGGTLVANGANGANGEPGQTGNAGGTAIAGNVIINGVGLTVTATGGQGGEGGTGDKGSDGDIGDPGGDGGTGGTGCTGGNGGSAFSGAVTIYAGSVTATGGQGGYGGTGGEGGYGGNGINGGNGGKGGTGGTGGTGGNGGYAFAGTLTVYGGNVNAYGGHGGEGGSDGASGSGGTGFDGGGDGDIGEPGEMGENGSDGVAYASNVTFQATTHTMTDGTNNITEATGKKTVIITSPDVVPGPPTYAITLAEGTEDADKWTISPNPAEEGSPVTVTYSGERKVKSVKAVKKAAAPAPANPKLGDLFYSDGTFSTELEAGKTPIGVIAYLDQEGTDDDEICEKSNGAGHGLVLCLKDAASAIAWSTEISAFEFDEDAKVADVNALKRTTNVSGYTNTKTLAEKTDAATKYKAAYAAKSYTGLTAPTGTTGWFLPSAQQWVKMQTGLGALEESSITWDISFDNNHEGADKWEAALSKAGSGKYDSMTNVNLWYWSSSEYSAGNAVNLNVCTMSTGYGCGFSWYYNGKGDGGTNSNFRVRPVLAF